ncbi:MAG: trypsin-like peptidase domain-containing protein [Saprospiraceae bacterium]|nr:trypsin-like peptidase domain-containing protein [Saprospiraceae bacterium]
MKSISILRFILWTALLIGGFFIGTAWKSNFNQQIAPQINADENPYNTNEDEQGTATQSPIPPGLNEDEKATIRLFESSAPSVAFITTSQLRQDYWTRNVMEIPQGSGSGFVWDKDGHVITNYHVIQGADKAQVTLADRTTWDATLVGASPEKDLAVLKIDAPKSALRPIPVGSSDNLLVGQSVLAIGNPFGLDQTLTTGIISALGREIKSVSGIPIRDVIQSDAAINPGNSGGPLLNSSGELIAVNTAIYSPSGASAGIGFSIPVDVVKWAVPDLIQFGKINRPSLGIELANAQTVQRLGLRGALITHVAEGSAAERAGLQPTYRDRSGRIRFGDAIVAINGEKVESGNDLILILEKYKAGDNVKVKVLRDEKEQEVQVRLDGSK